MKENKEQWNHRIKVELADGMRTLQQNRLTLCGDDQTLRELTEEAIRVYLRFNGVAFKEPDKEDG